jgi:aminoethylphosphonate catabolism LysR family transcriptional regulator
MLSSAQLRAFHAVFTERSFTAAARRLRVSQPAITMQVRALEEAHQVELFRRARGNVEPTELGQALFELTRRMLALEEEAEELLAAVGELRRGRLRLGADAPNHVIALLAGFRAKHAGIEVALSIGNSTEILRSVLDGHLDVAVVAELARDPRLIAIACARHRLVAFVAREHAWSKKKSVRLSDLAQAPLVLREQGSITRKSLEKALKKGGLRPTIAVEIQSREGVREAVAAGLGVGVVSEAEVGHDDRIVTLPIAGAELADTEYVVCLAERRRLRLIASFLELVHPLEKAGKRA